MLNNLSVNGGADQADASALAKEIKDDRENSIAKGDAGTVTLIHIDDLARLVQLRPVKGITLSRIRELFEKCSLPQECKAWIDGVLAEKTVRTDYATIVRTIARVQAHDRREPVDYGELRSELRHGKPSIVYSDLDDLREICKRMAGLAPSEIYATENTVELNQSADNVLQKIESATKAHLDEG